MVNGVSFGEKHSMKDWGLIFSSKSISSPEVQTKLVSVPGRNGSIDMSEVLTGNVRYNNRSISVTFYTKRDISQFPAFLAEIENYLHGRKCRIIFDDDPAFYWYGRCKVSSLTPDKSLGKLVITAEVEPFKYNITTSEEDWLWDPFDFEQSIINELSGISVNGSKEVTIVGTKRWENPIITSNAEMTVTYKGKEFRIKPGSQVMYEIIIEEGENLLVFNGNGEISINYVGGSL